MACMHTFDDDDDDNSLGNGHTILFVGKEIK